MAVGGSNAIKEIYEKRACTKSDFKFFRFLKFPRIKPKVEGDVDDNVKLPRRVIFMSEYYKVFAPKKKLRLHFEHIN
jgi:hypothetical protein